MKTPVLPHLHAPWFLIHFSTLHSIPRSNMMSCCFIGHFIIFQEVNLFPFVYWSCWICSFMNILSSALLALKAKPRPVPPGECVEWLKLANLTPLPLNNYGWSWTKLLFTLWQTADELERADPWVCAASSCWQRWELNPLAQTEPLSLLLLDMMHLTWKWLNMHILDIWSKLA